MLDIERAIAALADPTRRRILLRFYADRRPRTVDEVAAEAEVHRTVAFGHLERLAGLGLLASERRRGLRGKPANVYRLAAGALEVSHPPRRHTELAGLLAAALGRFQAAGVAAAREAGLRFASGLGGEGWTSLERLGAGYRQLEEGRIHASNCVFREACDQQRGVVCALHAGLLEGALGAGTVVPLGPDASGGCTFQVSKEEH